GHGGRPGPGRARAESLRTDHPISGNLLPEVRDAVVGTAGGPHRDEVIMRRWMGVSAALGSATVAALTGSAWAGTPVPGVPAQRAPSAGAHPCGHADTI